ncbi:hypothetical protein D3C76_1079370 [compost metagenome]
MFGIFTPEVHESGRVLITQIDLPERLLHLGRQQLDFIVLIEHARIRAGTIKATHHLQCVDIVLIAGTKPTHNQFSQGHGLLRYTIVFPSAKTLGIAGRVAEAMPIDLIRVHVSDPVLTQHVTRRRLRHGITIRPGIDNLPRNLFQLGVRTLLTISFMLL